MRGQPPPPAAGIREGRHPGTVVGHTDSALLLLQLMPLPSLLSRRILFSLRPLASTATLSFHRRKMATSTPPFTQEPHKLVLYLIVLDSADHFVECRLLL